MDTFIRRGGGIATVLTATFAALASQALAADFNNPNDKPVLCQLYAGKATYQAEQNIKNNCGGIGPRFTTDKLGHYNWCMAQKDVKTVNTEEALRDHQILRCNRCSGYVNNRSEFEKKWNSYGCGEIPELVQMDRYRGGSDTTSPDLLMFSCTYKPMSTDEIEAAKQADDHALALCIAHKNQHASSVKRAACGAYATDAVEKARQFQAQGCTEDPRFPGRMSTDVYQHYDWCLNGAAGNGVEVERNGRNADLQQCLHGKLEHDKLFTPVSKLGVKHTEIEHDKLFTPVKKLGVKNTPPEQPKKIIAKSVHVPRFKVPPIVLNFPRKPKSPPVVVTQTQTSSNSAPGGSKPGPSDTSRTDSAKADEPRSRSGQTEGDLGFPPKVTTKPTPPTPPVVVSKDVPAPKVATKPPPTPPVVVSNSVPMSGSGQTASDHVVVRALPRLVHNTAPTTNVGSVKPGISDMFKRGFKESLKQNILDAHNTKHREAMGITARLKSALKKSRERGLSRITTR
jgi:hypothetical protein